MSRGLLTIIARASERSAISIAFPTPHCFTGSHAPSVALAVCRARSCTKRGRWDAACDGSFGAAAWSTSAPGTACWRTSCSCWTTRRLAPSSSTRRSRRRARELHARARRGVAAAVGARITLVERALDDVELLPTDIVVSSHACGALADRVIECAVAARARVGVLPYCHAARAGERGRFRLRWVEPSLAIDLARVMRLKAQGYRVWTQTIPADITPKEQAADRRTGAGPRVIRRRRARRPSYANVELIVDDADGHGAAVLERAEEDVDP